MLTQNILKTREWIENFVFCFFLLKFLLQNRRRENKFRKKVPSGVIWAACSIHSSRPLVASATSSRGSHVFFSYSFECTCMALSSSSNSFVVFIPRCLFFNIYIWCWCVRTCTLKSHANWNVSTASSLQAQLASSHFHS